MQSGLENVREEIIRSGVPLVDQSADQLFATDITGDAEIEKKLRGKKLLKSEEILAQRSAVPGLEGRKRKADESVSEPGAGKRVKNGKFVPHKELQRLKDVADNAAGGVRLQDEAPTFDPWAVADDTVTKDPRFSFLDEVKPIQEPTTLRHAPASLAANGKRIPSVCKPEAGKSYNPLVGDWSALLEREGATAVENEKARLVAEAAEAEAEARALAEAEKVEAAERDEYATDYESAWESEWEGFQSGAEEQGMSHVQKTPRRKTPAERNKIKARKGREASEAWERKQKVRDAQEKRIKQIAKEVSLRDKARGQSIPSHFTPSDDLDSSADEGEVTLARRRFGQLPIPEAPLEVVLPDELQDSLRRLKPEGNLTMERYRNLLLNGKLEVRKQQWQRKQRKTERTEKWSYKDWRLR